MNDSKNEQAWNQLFEKYNIDEIIKKEGQYIIKSKDINEFREARLMTKFDYRFQLPKILANKHLSILPISRGEYVLSNIETFEDLKNSPDLEITEFSIPQYIESLDFSTITSEALAINCAYVSNIISDFTEDENLIPTVNGRMSSALFNFKIKKKNINEYLQIQVKNAQIEIDGGYEGATSLNLIEAKNNLSSDFLIRQLYYPYRLWKNKIKKTIRPIFLVYTNGIFHLREYKFNELENYNSISLVKEKKYRLKDSSTVVINTETIQNILHKSPIVKEPTDIPFPQADSFERVINLCEILYNKASYKYDKKALSSNYDFKQKDSFEMRQVSYYTDAAIYLGLIHKVYTTPSFYYFELTSTGHSLFETKGISERQLIFIKAILAHKAFNNTLKLYLKKAEEPTKAEIVQIMKESDLQHVGAESTFKRRASTILAWVNWILGTIEED